MTKPATTFAVLFDLDGVLINSLASNQAGRDEVAHLYGFTPEEMKQHTRPGGSLRDFYRRLQKMRPFEADMDTFADIMLEKVFDHLKKHVKPDPGTLAFIHRLKKDGIPFAIATSALKRSALRKLSVVGLQDAFDIIVTSNDVENHKPAPDVYLEAAKRLGVSPGKCIVIEDADDGVVAGKTAGMKVVGFNRYLDKDSKELEKADLVISDFVELTNQKILDLLSK